MPRLPLHLAVALVLCAAVALRGDDAPAPPGAGRMLQQLGEEDWILRAEALHYVGEHRLADAADPVRAILRDESIGPWVRGQALVALARIEPKVAGEDMAAYARHAQPALRGAAAEAIELLPADADDAALEALLGDDMPAVRYRALAAWAKRHGAAAWAKVDPMTQSLPPAAIESGARALAFVGSEAALARLAKLSENADHRASIIRGIGDVPNPKLLPMQLHLLTTLESDSDEFAAILSALAQHERADLLAAMQEALSLGEAAMIRTMAVVTTRLVVGPEIGDALRQSMEKVDDVETIRAALAALGPKEMAPDRHQELFSRNLNHEDVEIRALAIRCLAHCERVNLYDALRERLTDNESLVVHAALGALRRAPVDTAPQGKLVSYLRVAFDSNNPTTRTMAYELLGHAGGEEDFQPALAALGELLRGGDDARRAAAAEALGKIAPPGGIERLVRKQGYISNWMILGTFLNDRQNGGFNKKFPPEEKIDFTAKYQAKYVWDLAGEGGNKGEIEREIEWAQAAVDQTDGRLIIPPLVPPPASLSVAYAVADIRSAEEREVSLHVDGDDAFRIWLNDEQVAEQVAEYKHRQPCLAVQQGIKVKLRSGLNRLIVKTTNIEYQWWVRLRLTDEAGYPVEVQTP